MKTVVTYEVREYAADGWGALERPHVSRHDTLEEARDRIRRFLGRDDIEAARWRGEWDDIEDEPHTRGIEAYHASDEEGCGGYDIVELEERAMSVSIENEWINTDNASIMDDVLRLGTVSAAAEYNMRLLQGCIDAGDDRWRGATLDGMILAIGKEFRALVDSTDFRLTPEAEAHERMMLTAEHAILAAINEARAAADDGTLPLAPADLEDRHVEALCAEAAQAGDALMVAACKVWLTGGDSAARELTCECEALTEALIDDV